MQAGEARSKSASTFAEQCDSVQPMEPTASPTTETEAKSRADDSNLQGQEDRLVEEDLLVEEISIDGMCGVY